MTIKPIRLRSFSTGSRCLSPARVFSNSTACGPSNCDAGRAPGSACERHPASAPCKPSRADTSMLAWTAPSKCRPKTPNTISVTAGPNSQNGQPSMRFDRMSPHQSVPVCTARRWYRRLRRARRRLKADRHQRAPMLRRGEARVQDLWRPYERRFPIWWDRGFESAFLHRRCEGASGAVRLQPCLTDDTQLVVWEERAGVDDLEIAGARRCHARHLEGPRVCRLSAGRNRIRTCMGLFLQVGCFRFIARSLHLGMLPRKGRERLPLPLGRL